MTLLPAPPLTPPSDLDPGELDNGPFVTYWITWEGFQEEVGMEHCFSGSNILSWAP